MIFEDLTLDIKNIISQTNSYQNRPQTLNLPSSMGEICVEQIKFNEKWIRIAHIETELYKEDRFGEAVDYKSFGSIYFEKNKEKELPVAHLKYIPNLDFNLNEILDDKVITYIFLQKNHHIEDFGLIMLNPNIMKDLKLEMAEFNSGISARNELGEIVLKYNSWKTNYIGNGHVTGIADEIPLSDGAELVIRNDYFNKLIKPYSEIPYYKTITI